MPSTPAAEPAGSTTQRRRIRAVAGVAAGALAVGLLAAVPIASAQAADPAEGDLASRFTFAVLPDTQFYSRYSSDQFIPRYGSDPFQAQTAWLAENSDELDIPFVAHLGDIVDRVGTQNEWEAADTAMATLDDAELPYSILAGNHDVRNSNDYLYDDQYDLGNEPFLRWFGPDRAETQSTYEGSDPTGMNQYHIFEAEGQQFMVLALSWRASDATLAWADDVMAAHPTVPVILTTHQVIDIAADAVSPKETEYGLRLWDELIRSNDQIFMTLNGHFHGSSRLEKTNDAGHTVTEIVMDYQMAYEGGNGYLGLFEFDLTNGTIEVQTGSPWVVAKPQDSLTSYDQAFLEGPNQEFTLDVDFADRFSGFNPGFRAGQADTPSLSQRARDILLDGFSGPDPISTEAPGNESDFVEVPGTLAHWRFNGLDGVVDGDVTIPDVAGDNDLHRVDPADTNAVGAEWSDVTVQSDDVQGFSSDGSAVCFANSDQTIDDDNPDDLVKGRFSYLTTDADAPVNNADFSKGYTVETFVKMDSRWDATANGWSKYIVHTGNRSKIEGFGRTQWDWTASPTALGISNLREFQWTAVPADPTKGDKTNWSGEIMVDSWAHVAIVNDPVTGTITMYVDGAPVLRNAIDAAGLADNDDMPWILGSDWVDDAARNGWNGCIGETRIIDHPTTPEQWLTQRADLTGFAVADAPEGTLPWDAEVTELSGTGLPGAEVRLAGSLTGTQTIDENGEWTLAFPEPLGAGAYELSLVQALGSRESEPVMIDFGIAAEPTPEPTDTPAPTDTPEPTDAPRPSSTPAAPAGSNGSDEPTGLAATGVELSPLVPLGAVLALLLGAAAVFVIRRPRSRA
ncbi:LamG-like jellyroll fold domain-containing protein [Compostimonas suwonensis]|uniref:Calcineurin-like phosphoesterase family protein n=1 Tax=Compostimonas suwonensis TaxID=1048394 RepID=A0A2M9BU94_9MICO|nr:metallophosphoesterase [Compostimonas suwonensis]PJJ61526.1 calcineurin-like phosphoesterase family protein [Compostimonas suwonensis]